MTERTAPTAWHVVKTKPRAEFQAAYHLMRLNYRAFAPYCFVQRRHARKTEDVRRPVFVGYVFLGIVGARPLYDVDRCVGVSHLVTFDDKPAVIPTRVVRKIMDECDSDGWMRSADDRADLERLEVGSTVKVVQGPLEGLIAQINRLDASGGVCLSVEMLGAKSVSVKPSAVKPIEAVSP